MADQTYDPTLLVTFLTVAQTSSFTEAGRRLDLGQSTVSQHVRRLEATVGRRLFVRDTHAVTLTADGQAMVSFARAILDANERARRYFAGSELRGRLRFGASEDFALSRLSEVLRDFTQRHPAVDLELTVALSGELYQLLDAGELDLAVAKRRLGEDRGRLVWREKLVWIGRETTVVDPSRPLPLVMYPPPSITRAIAIEVLDRAGVPWRIVCTCGGLVGLRAATLAGFGLMVQPQSMVPPGLVALSPTHQLPSLGEIEFVLVGASKVIRGPAAELARAIQLSHDRLQARSLF
jgi:DNA-binding transcriptional LysR family regulator